jgi:hypothetical protein
MDVQQPTLWAMLLRFPIHRWQRGHQNVERCPSVTWRIGVPQTWHGSPVRP